MKKLCILVLCLFVVGVVSTGVFAENLESLVVNVSTELADGDSYEGVAEGSSFSLDIGSHVPKILISRITLTSADLSKAQTVTLWEGWSDGTSSATVRKIWEWDLDALSSSETITIQEYFLDGDRAYLKADYGLGVTKTDSGAGVTMSIQYK